MTANESNFWESLYSQYASGTFLDTKLMCPNAKEGTVHLVRCHSLVLASMSPTLRAALEEIEASAGGLSAKEPAIVVVPGVEGDEVMAAIEAIYR